MKTDFGGEISEKLLIETDILTKFITPAIIGAHCSRWDFMAQMREEAYFTKGFVIVRFKNGQMTWFNQPCQPQAHDFEDVYLGLTWQPKKVALDDGRFLVLDGQ